MKNLALLISVFLLLLNSVSAQKMYKDLTTIFGDLNLERGKKVILINAFKVPDGYVVFKKEPIKGPGGYHYFLEKFNEEMNSLRVHDVTRQFEGEGYVIDEIIKVGESYVLFTTKNDKSKRKEELYAQLLDWKSAKLGNRQLIYSQEYAKRQKYIDYELSTSPNEKFLLVTVHPLHDKKSKEKIHFWVFDDEMNEEWGMENFKINKEDRNYSILNTELGANGNLYLLGRKFTPKNKEKGTDANTTYEVLTINKNGVEAQKIPERDKYFENISLTVSETGELYLAGYYWKERGTGTDGVFLFTLDDKGEIVAEIWDAFSKEFITDGWSERSKKKAKKKEAKGRDLGLSNLEFRKIVQHQDGSSSIVGEIYWTTTYTTTDANGHTHTHTVYHYGDLIVTRISKQGEVVGHARYEKHHTYFGAYTYFDLNNDLAILIYKDKLDLMGINTDGMKKKERRKLSGSILAMVLLSDTGEEFTYGLIDYTLPANEEKMHLQFTSNMFLLEDNEILFLTGSRKKQLQLSRMKLE